jgi:hypothetical protein
MTLCTEVITFDFQVLPRLQLLELLRGVDEDELASRS